MNNARQQTYRNQTAFQGVQESFNTWQAGFNADMTNLNNEYKYWGETVAYNEKLAYAGQLENYEFAKEMAQATRVWRLAWVRARITLVNAEAIQAAYGARDPGSCGAAAADVSRLAGVSGLSWLLPGR